MYQRASATSFLDISYKHFKGSLHSQSRLPIYQFHQQQRCYDRFIHFLFLFMITRGFDKKFIYQAHTYDTVLRAPFDKHFHHAHFVTGCWHFVAFPRTPFHAAEYYPTCASDAELFLLATQMIDAEYHAPRHGLAHSCRVLPRYRHGHDVKIIRLFIRFYSSEQPHHIGLVALKCPARKFCHCCFARCHTSLAPPVYSLRWPGKADGGWLHAHQGEISCFLEMTADDATMPAGPLHGAFFHDALIMRRCAGAWPYAAREDMPSSSACSFSCRRKCLCFSAQRILSSPRRWREMLFYREAALRLLMTAKCRRSRRLLLASACRVLHTRCGDVFSSAGLYSPRRPIPRRRVRRFTRK